MMLDLHPLCAMFPQIAPEQMDFMVADIKKHGLREPIVKFEGKILDGQNRQEACARAGVEPRYVEFTGPDPVAFVISANLARRHLDTKTRSLLAAKLTGHGITQVEAAARLGVSVPSVQRAARLAKTPKFEKAVAEGRLTAQEAAAGLALPPEILASLPNRGWENILKAQIERNKTRQPIERADFYVNGRPKLPTPEGHPVMVMYEALVASDTALNWFGPDHAIAGIRDALMDWAARNPV